MGKNCQPLVQPVSLKDVIAFIIAFNLSLLALKLLDQTLACLDAGVSDDCYYDAGWKSTKTSGISYRVLPCCETHQKVVPRSS